MTMFDAVICQDEGRRAAVLVGVLDGIDAVEVEVSNQTTLHVFFLKGGVPAGLNHRPDLCRITGGERVTHVHVLDTVAQADHLDVVVDVAGDFSTYTLSLASPLLDPVFATVPFSFKAGCPSPFDCPGPAACIELPESEPSIDYWVKDYAGFRLALLDWIAAHDPNWPERSEADAGIALVDLFAYSADQLSDYQDRVANEMYLGTARQRVSVKRHSALIDYVMHEGANAHAYLHVHAGAGLILPVSSQVTTVPERGGLPIVFETDASVSLFVDHNEFSIYTWSNDECCLSAGATQTYLDQWHPNFRPGDYVLFEEVKSPETRLEADADRTRRQVVRLTSVARANDPLVTRDLTLVQWRAEDALLRDFCLTTRCADRSVLRDVSVARGNVVPASHGRTVRQVPDPTVPEPAPTDERICKPAGVVPPSAFAFQLDEPPLTYTTDTADPRDGRSTVQIVTPPNQTWQERRTLLESGPFDRHFVVDTDEEGRATIRFGDGTYGRAAPPGTAFSVSYRIGNGVAGNVGAEKLVLTLANLGPGGYVRNPLPASGGVDPEPIAIVKRDAPQAFRAISLRAVTAEDYARAAQLVPGVHRAVAQFRWTGSWHTVFVTVAPLGRTDLTDALKQRVLTLLESYRMAGYDLELRPPRYVALDIAIDVCVLPDFFRAHVQEALYAKLGARDLPDGTRGFFHPDNFSFGDALYLSRLYQAIMAVEGVQSAQVTTFQPWGKQPANELTDGVINTSGVQIVRLDNDPSEQEHGRLVLNMLGGK